MGSCQSSTTAAPAAMDKNKPVPHVTTFDEYNALRANSQARALAFELSFRGLQAQRKKTLEQIRNIMLATRAADAENAKLEAELAAMMAEDEAKARERRQRNVALI